MSYNEFLRTFGHLSKPTLKQAFSVWYGDLDGPDTYVYAMRWYTIASQQTSLHGWCRFMWKAKKAWALYLREQDFPLPVAQLVE